MTVSFNKKRFYFWLFKVLCGNVGQTASLSSANWQFTLQNHTKPQRTLFLKKRYGLELLIVNIEQEEVVTRHVWNGTNRYGGMVKGYE